MKIEEAQKSVPPAPTKGGTFMSRAKGFAVHIFAIAAFTLVMVCTVDTALLERRLWKKGNNVEKIFNVSWGKARLGPQA